MAGVGEKGGRRMTNKEAIEYGKKWDEAIESRGDTSYSEARQFLRLAIKAIKHEAYWEEVKQALNDWLNNISSPQTALNDIYRAYMGKGEEDA